MSFLTQDSMHLNSSLRATALCYRTVGAQQIYLN